MGLKTTGDIQSQGGVPLAPATQSIVGPETLAGVRSVTRKYGQILRNSPLRSSEVFTTPWVDTNLTGDVYLSVNAFLDSSLNSISNALQIQGTNDPGNADSFTMLAGSLSAQVGSSQIYNLQAALTLRYWRVQITNAAVTTKVTQISAVGFSVPPTVGATQPAAGKLLVTTQVGDANTGGYADGAEYVGLSMTTNAGQDVPAVMPAFVTSAVAGSGTQSTFSAARTPNIFRGGQVYAAAGAVPIWTPLTGKKIRLMRYKIEVGEDCTITSGPLPVNLGFGWGLAPSTNYLNSAAFAGISAFTHRFVLPATVLATSFEGYDSGWIDLGNGSIAGLANQALYAGLMVPQTTSPVNPTWTTSSIPWEAISIGFKTLNAAGNFKLTTISTAAGVATAPLTAASVKGNTIIIVVRTTNSATGIPAFSVSSNTAGDAYTATAVQTLAGDGANGSSLCILYVTNTNGAASNAITVSATNSPTACYALYLEYAGMGTGGIDAAAVGATGTSTAPASGNYTPATAGDLIVTAFASATQNNNPTIGSNFFIRGGIVSAGVSLFVADNFGNGAMAAGAVNVIACGTEE